MSQRFIYLLYDQMGDEMDTLRATDNPGALPGMLRDGWPTAPHGTERAMVEMVAKGLVTYERHALNQGEITLMVVPLL